MASDWLAAVLAANQKVCLKTVSANNDLLIKINVSKPNPCTSEHVGDSM